MGLPSLENRIKREKARETKIRKERAIELDRRKKQSEADKVRLAEQDKPKFNIKGE